MSQTPIEPPVLQSTVQTSSREALLDGVLALLEDWGACEGSLEWVRKQPDPSIPALWNACPNGIWMVWVLDQMFAESRNPEIAEAGASVRNLAVTGAIAALARHLDQSGIAHSILSDPSPRWPEGVVDAVRPVREAARIVKSQPTAETYHPLYSACVWVETAIYDTACEDFTGSVGSACLAVSALEGRPLIGCTLNQQVVEACRPLLPLLLKHITLD